MRIVTRPDFDGVVCAALLQKVETVDAPILWTEPNDIQKGMVDIAPGDIIANLPFHPKCELWFDHHYTNRPRVNFRGAFRIAPSAARVIYEYYDGRFSPDYDELIRQTDKIDAADLSREEVNAPERYPHILISMTLSGFDPAEAPYWNRLVELLAAPDIETVIADPEVRRRCDIVETENRAFRTILADHTRMDGHVSVTDFRDYETQPRGNRFLVYAMYPEAVVSMKIRNHPQEPGKVIIGLGHSIFNRQCRVNVGLLLSEFGGGGHRGAGSCTVPADEAEACARKMTEILKANQSNEN